MDASKNWNINRLIKHCFVLITLLCIAVLKSYGQEPQERVYAASQASGGVNYSVDNANGAVDNNLSTHSTIRVFLLGSVWQRLQFPTTLSAGTTIRVKIGTTGNILSLLGNIRIQAYNGNSPVGSDVAIGSLITLLAGEDQAEIVFTPSASFNSVRISSAGVSLGDGLKIYEAYYLRPSAPDLIACDTPVDILYGSTGNLASGTNAVEDPYNAMDGDPESAAIISANVSLLNNRTHLTALYNTVSAPTDSIRIILRRPGSLLDVGLVSKNFYINTSLDGANQTPILSDSQFISLHLLSPGSDIQVLTLPIDIPFNRIEISLGEGLANALTSLEVFEIQRVLAKPEVTASNAIDGVVTICENETTTLEVVDALINHDYYWYTETVGGSPIHTGTAYFVNPTDIGTFTYYVAKSRTGCIEQSARTKIDLQVLPLPGKPHLTISDVIH